MNIYKAYISGYESNKQCQYHYERYINSVSYEEAYKIAKTLLTNDTETCVLKYIKEMS